MEKEKLTTQDKELLKKISSELDKATDIALWASRFESLINYDGSERSKVLYKAYTLLDNMNDEIRRLADSTDED